MQFINDTFDFIKTLEFFDVLFFFAVLALMMLIISLVYFIKENSSEEEFIFEETPKLDLTTPEKSELDNLKDIISDLEEAEPTAVNLNHYEVEQEEKAIISYDELLKKRNDFAINYSDEESITEDLTIRKVDLDNLINKDVVVKPKLNVSVISYEKEEAFLEALKTLQQKLN